MNRASSTRQKGCIFVRSAARTGPKPLSLESALSLVRSASSSLAPALVARLTAPVSAPAAVSAASRAFGAQPSTRMRSVAAAMAPVFGSRCVT